jgi:DNA-binding response OmpR family regulator
VVVCIAGGTALKADHPAELAIRAGGTSLASIREQLMFATQHGANGRAPARILVAEDDADLRPMLALALTEAGFEVVEAADGSILLDYLAGSLEEDGTFDKFDVIVSDIQMPGFTALDVLAGSQRFVTRTPILLVTAVSDPEVHERARQLGAAGVMTKPVDVDELCLEVCRLLTRSMPGLNAT